jgi:hypothetical protein
VIHLLFLLTHHHHQKFVSSNNVILLFLFTITNRKKILLLFDRPIIVCMSMSMSIDQIHRWEKERTMLILSIVSQSYFFFGISFMQSIYKKLMLILITNSRVNYVSKIKKKRGSKINSWWNQLKQYFLFFFLSFLILEISNSKPYDMYVCVCVCVCVIFFFFFFLWCK